MSADVVVPIYNGLNQVEACVRSLIDNTPEKDASFILADDASPDAHIPDLLTRLAEADKRVTVIRRPRNLGFVANSNQAMVESDRDVVLLNSDTVVPPNWLGRLAKIAHQSERIGSVTPLSNNAEIASAPGWLRDNTYPGGVSTEDLDDIAASVGVGEWIEIPTSVGFCVYLRRTALDAVGLFDEESFGRGYGEENDLSLRMRDAGFLNLLCDRVFVSHVGGVSFSETSENKTEKQMKTLTELWPDYEKTITRYISDSPLSGVQSRFGLELMERTRDKSSARVLHMLHHPITRRIIGGVEHHVNDLVQGLSDAHESLVVSRWIGGTELEWFHDNGFTSLPVDLPGETTEWVDRALALEVGVVHIHHTWGFQPEVTAHLLGRCHELGVPVVWSLHDYNALTPHDILRSDGTECAGLDDEGICLDCERRLAPSGWDVRSRRHEYLRQIGSADVVITPSQSAADRYQSYAPDLEIGVRPHGIDTFTPTGRPPHDGPTRIGILGKGGAHKGDLVLPDVMGALSESDIEWHLLGREELPGVAANVTVVGHGLFPHDRIYEVLEEVSLDAIVLLSQVDETFSLALSEAWMMGIPVFGSDRGALVERIGRQGGGVVIPHNDAAAAAKIIESVIGDDERMKRLSHEAREAALALPDRSEMIAGYGRLYADLHPTDLRASATLVPPPPTVEEWAGWLASFESPLSASSYLDEELGGHVRKGGLEREIQSGESHVG